MKNKEDRMIDFVAGSYEENRFDPKKALARSQSGTVRRSLWFGKLTDRVLKRTAGVAAATLLGIFLYTSWRTSWTDYTAHDIAQTFTLPDSSSVNTSWRTSWTDYTAYDIAQTFTLPDSSSVTLAPGATLRLQPRKDNRLVQMTGRIWFNVRHDDSTPFRIDAGYGFVRVLGTRFQVDAPDSVSVNVLSGKVLFSAAQSEEGIVLTKGQSAVLRKGSSAPVRLTPKHPNPAAWATGEFIYDNTPLSEVLSELTDYYGVRLYATEQSSVGSAAHRLSGEFSTASLPEILDLINSALGTDIRFESQPTR